MEHKSYQQLLRESFKSNDTEEWLDIWFTRPIGLALALLCGRLGITPNAITIAGIVIGAIGGWMFHYSDMPHNICAVALLMFANFCDSADGQLARITNQKTLLGRVLDGFASDVWFFCVYVAIVYRLWNESIPLLGISWQWWGFLLCAYAGLRCHSTQCALADYYRNIHLWFLKGDTGSELDSYEQEQRLYDSLKTQGWSFERLYHFFYKGYCRKQERLTPKFQTFFKTFRSSISHSSFLIPHFLNGSRPLMPFTNILTHNTRAFALFVAALINIPWIYPLFEIVVLQPLYWWMRYRHEHLCETLTKKML
ncbi:MAG: CDP-alcohol phosphatidyltransferase family protein [Prevotella sp.]|nr:CDP-alcohol phosphatidyltransferase family protein [Prevotella sp.]